MGTSHEDHHTFLIISHSSLLRMRNVSDKIVEKIKKKINSMFNNFFFFKSLSIYEII